jgi:ubiquinone biosynthesis protein UbiJ
LNSATIDSQDDFAAKISGSSLEFYKLLKKSNSIQELNLKLEGNINVAQNLNTLFLKINIDWGKILIPYIGESCGPQLANLIQTISRQTKSKFNSMTQMLNDYLIEEAQLTPAKWEVEEFIQEVNQFKHDLERLTARINYALSATNSQTN